MLKEASSLDAMLAKREVLGPAYRLFYEEPLYPVKGEGVWLTDHQGRRYLDAYNNVPVVGHCNPKVVAAMTAQASTLCTHTRYLHDGILTYADRLLAHFPSYLNRLMLTCTGSEANDLAIRIAEAVTGGTGVVVTSNAYHGVSHLLAKLSPSLAPIADFVRVVAPPRAAADAASNAAEAQRFATDVTKAFADLQAAGFQPCALLMDMIFASDGILPPSAGLLNDAAQAARHLGAVVIADEVQAGFGRTGDNWWGFVDAALQPDIVTLGKPMGNGYPIAGVVATEEMVATFADKGRYFNTFGGNPVAVATGMAVLDELEQRQLPTKAGVLGQGLQAAFAQELAGLGTVEIRGKGLYWGIEIAADGKETATERATRVTNHMRQNGVLLSNSGPDAKVLKIRPPLVFEQEHAQMLVAALKQALQA